MTQIDTSDTKQVQEALNGVVQGIGARFTSVNQNATALMARVDVEDPPEGESGSGIFIRARQLNFDDPDWFGFVSEMTTVGEDGLWWKADNGQEYTIYPFGDAMDAQTVRAGKDYEKRLEAEQQAGEDYLQQLLDESKTSETSR